MMTPSLRSSVGNPYEKMEKPMIQVKGKKRSFCRAVPKAYMSLNHHDVFILDTKKEILVWNGPRSPSVKRAKALDFLRRAATAMPDDIEVWLEYAELLQRRDVASAFKAYEHALQVWREQVEMPVPPEMLNNFAVLKHKLGDSKEALAMLRQALAQIDEVVADAALPQADKVRGTAGSCLRLR